MKRLMSFLLVSFCLLSPAFGAELTEAEKAEAVSAVAEKAISACVDDTMTDVEKLTVLHDWVCLNVDYGATTRATTAYGALTDGKAVCTGYADAYACLAETAGLEGFSTYSEDMDHAWILATLDGARYFSDCTWDDGKRAKLGLIRHTYWLFDAENAWDTGEHYGWDSAESVPGGELETAPWGTAMTRVVFCGDYCWYMDEDFCLWRCDRHTWQTERLFRLREYWPIWGTENSRRDGLYSGLVLLDGRLYFNTPYEIRSVDLNGEDMKTEFVPDTTEGVIYGIGVQDGNIVYSLATEPDAVKYDVLDSGISAVGAWGYLWETSSSGEPSDDNNNMNM